MPSDTAPTERALARRIRALRRRVLVASWAGTTSRAGAVALVALGAAALILRLAAGWGAGAAALVLAPVALVPLVAWLLVRRRVPSEGAAATWIDVGAGADGSVVTALELGDARWADRARAALDRAPAPPGLRARPLALRLVPAAVFAALALAIPVGDLAASPAPTADVLAAPLEELREKLTTLEEEIEFDEEEAEELETALDRLEQEAARGAELEAAFEAFDRLEQRFEQEAARADTAARSAVDSLAAADALAEASPTAAARELQDALDALVEAGLDADLPTTLAERLDEGALEGLDLEALDLPEGFSVDAETMRSLSEEMRGLLAEKLARLADAGLLEAAGLPSDGPLLDPAELAELTAADLALLEPCPHCAGLEPGEP